MRLKVADGFPNWSAEYRFQFQTGAIKRTREGMDMVLIRFCFNSKLVRLKASPGARVRIEPFLFQFQTGAIKRRPRGCWITNTETFQCQTGAIKRDIGAFDEDHAGIVSIPNWCD